MVRQKQFLFGISACFFLLFGNLFPSSLFGQVSLNDSRMIGEIRIEGLSSIEKGLVYSVIQSQPSTTLNPMTVADDIKELFKQGYFTDVKVDIEPVGENQVALIYILEEKPKIIEINIEGHSEFATDTIREELKVFKNNLVNISKIEADVKAISKLYRKDGFIQTQVDYQLKNLGDGLVSLTYLITENPKVFLSEIVITGTKAFPPLDIKRQMSSIEADCFTYLNDSGVFEEEKINQDLQILVQHYYSNGFVKVVIDKPEVTLIRNPDYSKIRVEININEGEQYHVGKVAIETPDGNDFLVDKEAYVKDFNMQTGDVFNPFKMNSDRFKINELYQSRGYAFARIGVSNKINEKDRTIDTVFNIVRGEKAYFGRIDISGNYETRDDVIRREFTVHDNELYNGVKLRESQQAVYRLGYFDQQSGVSVRQTPGEEENTLNYNIVVKEGQTGSFQGSLTYSQYSGFSLMGSFSTKNIFGTGRSLTLSIEQGVSEDNSNSISLTTPYWFGTNFTNSIQIFSSLTDETYYDVRKTGFDFGLTYPFWKDWYVFGNLNWTDETYSDITDLGSEYLDGATSNASRSIKLGAKYSTVNNLMFPTDGYETSLSAEQFGGFLAGTVHYQEYTLDAKYYKTLNDAGTIVFNAGFAWSRLAQTDSNTEIPYHKRYQIGGITTVRGFEWYEIEGPSSVGELGQSQSDFYKSRSDLAYQGDYDDCTGSCLSLPTTKPEARSYFERHRGGIDQKVLNLNLLVPLTREGQNIRGVIFFDAGNVWSENRMYEIAGIEKNPWYFRTSAGVGVRLITPMGVFRFEYGIKLNPKPNESPGKFDFFISGLF